MQFEWDPAKAIENLEKHSVSFDSASTAFGDSNGLIKDDPDHSDEEVRSILLGQSSDSKLLVVSYTLRGEAIRFISAREATPAENREYSN